MGSNYTPPIPRIALVAECVVQEEHYEKFLLIPNMAYLVKHVNGLDAHDYQVVYGWLMQAHGTVEFYLVPTKKPEDVTAHFPRLWKDSMRWYGPRSDLFCDKNASDWLRFADENCKEVSGAIHHIRGPDSAYMLTPEIEWRNS